jgi:serine/threonine protein kinase
MTLRGGRYETLREIASGGMAKVHLGRALGAGGFERLVAIKAMHPHLADEPEFVDMFLDEARLAASIRHPNVVGTLDVQEDEQGIFLVMEYVEGPSLSAILKGRRRERRSVTIEIALRIFLDTLAGLHAAHELTGADGEPLRLVHRDVSPQNVLVGVDGIARITDFGIARAESRLTTTQGGAVKGKLPYMAPEQIHGHPTDRRTDIYAAGAVLWELLTRERLVRGDTDAERIHKIISDPVRSPRELNPAIPEPLAETCQKALQKDPTERFPTMAAFADAIEEAARAAGVTIATARGVSTFVKDLELHHSPTDLPSASELGPRSVPRSWPAPPARSSASARAEPESSSTHVNAVMPSERPPRAPRSSGALFVIGGVGVLVGAAAGALFLHKPRAPQGHPLPEAATLAAEASPARSSPSTPGLTAAPAAEDLIPTEAQDAAASGDPAAAAPLPSPSATPRAAATAKAASEPRASTPRRGGTRFSPKAGPKSDAQRPSSATSFRPKEL